MSQTVENDYVSLELLESGILIATYKKYKRITLEIAKEIVRMRLTFTGREPRPVLVMNMGVTEISKPARKHLSSGDGIAGISASAIVVDNAATAFIVGFILWIERPLIPVKPFERKENAM